MKENYRILKNCSVCERTVSDVNVYKISSRYLENDQLMAF